MKTIFICIAILEIIYILLDKTIQRKKSKKKKNDIYESFSEPTLYPYKKKYLLTKAEYAFYRILKQKCDERNLLICPKVRLEDFIQVTTKEQQLKYRGYIKSRHIDFLICDYKLNIITALELLLRRLKILIFNNHIFGYISAWDV